MGLFEGVRQSTYCIICQFGFLNEFIRDLTRLVSLQSGVCTRAGACRFQGEDFMYQGGCGEISRSGRVY